MLKSLCGEDSWSAQALENTHRHHVLEIEEPVTHAGLDAPGTTCALRRTGAGRAGEDEGTGLANLHGGKSW